MIFRLQSWNQYSAFRKACQAAVSKYTSERVLKISCTEDLIYPPGKDRRVIMRQNPEGSPCTPTSSPIPPSGLDEDGLSDPTQPNQIHRQRRKILPDLIHGTTGLYNLRLNPFRRQLRQRKQISVHQLNVRLVRFVELDLGRVGAEEVRQREEYDHGCEASCRERKPRRSKFKRCFKKLTSDRGSPGILEQRGRRACA